MTAGGRERFIARISQLRRPVGAGDAPAAPSSAGGPNEQIRALEERVTHLEQLLQGLQDSVHRESRRHSKRIDDLEERVKPAALGKALTKDARERGL